MGRPSPLPDNGQLRSSATFMTLRGQRNGDACLWEQQTGGGGIAKWKFAPSPVLTANSSLQERALNFPERKFGIVILSNSWRDGIKILNGYFERAIGNNSRSVFRSFVLVFDREEVRHFTMRGFTVRNCFEEFGFQANKGVLYSEWVLLSAEY
ncbi:hypothetical protein CEXT_781801 [Caerostris extrusa]|uniref:Ornithine decarboxylase antizyme n=1 Tax=Caerostris extrusa TaxID=172846 RepID=A0AAV4R607_CAEEX|nr:hypothetical protein CEXT_781801 [Caerostris extrusa]